MISAIILMAITSVLILGSFISTQSFVAHDFPLFFSQSRDFSPFWAIAWDYMGNGGIGAPAFKTLWVDLYANFVYFMANALDIPWGIAQRIFWIIPSFLLPLVSAYLLSSLFIKNPLLRGLSSLIYSFNTYILLVVGGGQFGIVFAYGLAPLALYTLINLFKKRNVFYLLLSGLVTGLLIAADPRIALLLFSATFLWFIAFEREEMFSKIKFLIPVGVIALLLNSYWMLPIFMSKGSVSTYSNYLSLEGVKFLSFATLSDSASLLHPNWPENIFGKIYFYRPQFLLITILAFATLLLKPKKEILFFIFLSLISILFAKGASEPLGSLYLFLFDHVPGFGLFRDSTKFYLLIAISYSIMIPYFFENFPKKVGNVLALLFIAYFLLTLKPVYLGEVSGIFKQTIIPESYKSLNEELSEDKTFYRTLWVPQKQKLGYFDPNHPALDAKEIVGKSEIEIILKKFSDQSFSKEIENYSVRYVIVPQDTDSEIFLKDRKYDAKQYKLAVGMLDKVPWLAKNDSFNGLAVYETKAFKNRFYGAGDEISVDYRYKNPTELDLTVDGASGEALLVFSEGYHPSWRLKNSKKVIKSEPYGALNSFRIPTGGEENYKVFFETQRYVNIGLFVSVATFLGIFGLMIFGKLLRKW